MFLLQASGMFAPRPGSSTGGGSGPGIPDGGWFPATIPAPAPNIPTMEPVMEPTPVNDYGNPAPSYQAFSQDPKPFPPAGGIPAPAARAPAHAAGGIPAQAPPKLPPADPTRGFAPTIPPPIPSTQPTATPPGFPAMPTGTVPPPLPPANPTQPVDNESYTGAMQAAMAGAVPSDSTGPVLDSTNAGTESYPGAFVIGSEGRAGVCCLPHRIQ